MKTTVTERRVMVDKANTKLNILQQCILLSIHRSGYYYKKKVETSFNLELMDKIDKEYTKHPFRGVPSMTEYLQNTYI
jgi:putative transposase